MKRNQARWDLDQIRYCIGKAPAPNREIRSLGEILPDVMDGLETPQSENILILRRAWPKLVGEQIAQHSTPAFIKDFALYIDIDLPGWMPELVRIKRVLLQKLQAQYRELNVRTLNFQLEHK